MASGCEQHGQSCLDLKCLLNHFCLWSSPAWQSVSKVSWRHRTESAESRAVAANEKVKKTLAIAPDRLTSSPPGYNLEAYVLLETNHISLNVSRHLFHLVNHRDLEPRGWAVYKVEFWATICVVLTYIPSTSTPSIPTELFWLDASHPLTSPGSPSFTNRATCCSLSNHNYPLPSVCCSGPVIMSAFFFPLSSLIPFLFFEEKKNLRLSRQPPPLPPLPLHLLHCTHTHSSAPQNHRATCRAQSTSVFDPGRPPNHSVNTRWDMYPWFHRQGLFTVENYERPLLCHITWLKKQLLSASGDTSIGEALIYLRRRQLEINYEWNEFLSQGLVMSSSLVDGECWQTRCQNCINFFFLCNHCSPASTAQVKDTMATERLEVMDSTYIFIVIRDQKDFNFLTRKIEQPFINTPCISEGMFPRR